MKRRHRTHSATVSLLLFLLVPGHLTFAQTKEDQREIDPRAERVIEQVSQYYSALKSLQAEASTSVTVQAEGIKHEMSATYNIAMQRPNKFLMDLTSGMMGMTIVCDGTHVYTFMPMMNKYTVEDAPADLDSLVTKGALDDMKLGVGNTPFIGFIIHSKPYELIMEGVLQVKYLGLAEVDGRPCHHLKFFRDEFDWELWVESGEKPLVRRISPDMSKTFERFGDSMPGMKELKLESAITFRDWAHNIDLPQDRFKFTPPTGSKKVASLMEGFAEDEPHPLLGKAAPSFKLELLEGGELNLAEHKNKNIVILDFWATWCGPCRKTMPGMAKVAAAYEGKGVKVYAVNLRENREKIRRFLKNQGLKITVAMDKDGRVGSLYRVRGIPQTVVIGKDGSVQVVHVGALPNLSTRLREELDSLLAGTNLASRATSHAGKPGFVSQREGAEPAWSLEGSWVTLATNNGKGANYAGSARGKDVELNVAGIKQREFKVSDTVTILRTANLVGDSHHKLITFRILSE